MGGCMGTPLAGSRLISVVLAAGIFPVFKWIFPVLNLGFGTKPNPGFICGYLLLITLKMLYRI